MAISTKRITKHVAFLRSTLIPDLRESGRESMAKDFHLACLIIEQQHLEIATLRAQLAAATKVATRGATPADEGEAAVRLDDAMRAIRAAKTYLVPDRNGNPVRVTVPEDDEAPAPARAKKAVR